MDHRISTCEIALFVGDCLQLPPVVAGQSEREYFTERYRTPWFFGADIFNDLPVFAVELSTVHRQTDVHFVELLDRIRTNDNHRDAVAEISRHCFRDREFDNSTIILTTTNRHADSINQRRLDDIESPSRTYWGEKRGKFGLDGQRLPAPEELVLKRGAQVMVTKNVSGAVNGTLAKIIDLSDDHIVITLPDTGVPTVQYHNLNPVVCMTAPNPLPTVLIDDTLDTDNPPVKRSGSGICHDQNSPWYNRTRNFTPFATVTECIASGGRLPRS